MQQILVLNPKGGSGKTTIATNLASYYAAGGEEPMLCDNDPQGSSLHWLKQRPSERPRIHAVMAFERGERKKLPVPPAVPPGCSHVIIDSPAALAAQDMPELTRSADAIIVPVMSSEVDIHAFLRCIADLLLIGKVGRWENRLGVVANRVKRNTVAYQSLMRFLQTLRIPIVTTLRDSQNYVRCTATGIGLHEMSVSQAGQDLDDWVPLVSWLRAREVSRGRQVSNG